MAQGCNYKPPPFLSTLSLRRATFQLVGGVAGRVVFLSTLSLRRATGINFIIFDLFKISIHALLAESDRHWQTGQSRTRQFLSTLSLRRATWKTATTWAA